MEFSVDASLPVTIVVGATGLVQLMQEIRTVLSTRKGSVPLDRDFGLDWSILDSPMNAIKPRYVADVARQVEKYVPRVKVVEVRFIPGGDAVDGIAHPVVRVSIRQEYANDFRQGIEV